MIKKIRCYGTFYIETSENEDSLVKTERKLSSLLKLPSGENGIKVLVEVLRSEDLDAYSIDSSIHRIMSFSLRMNLGHLPHSVGSITFPSSGQTSTSIDAILYFGGFGFNL